MQAEPDMAGARVLVVEDEYLVARDIQRALERAGAEVIGPVARLNEALGLLAGRRDLTAAVLDVKLADGMVFPVADALRRRGVPFVFATGYDAASMPPGYRATLRCDKPCDAQAVLDLLRQQAEGPEPRSASRPDDEPPC